MLHRLGACLKAPFSRLGDQRAAISPLMALMIVPIAGATAMATEMGQWWYFQRSLQNAADSAAIAAATTYGATSLNNTAAVSEATATARSFGYINGQSSTTVAAAPAACPAGTPTGSICYQATLTKVLPITLSALVGFRGDANGGFAQTISAVAIATTAGSTSSTQTACIWSLSSDPTSFTSNGGPKPDLAGCSILSNGGATCNGHDLGADYGIAVGTSSGCGKTQVSGATAPSDPYKALKSNIPSASSKCSSYAKIPSKKSDPALPAGNQLSGSMSIAASSPKCGDVQLTGDVTLTGHDNVLTIYNGTLDLNGHTLKTASGADATIIFSGDSTSSSVRAPTGGGTLDIQAPGKDSTSVWKGMAMYQDPNMSGAPASALNITYAGNTPTWNISGIVYLPLSSTTFSGAVNKSSNGASCFVLISYTILVNGTGSIFANNTGCADAGATPPGVVIPGATTREKLVL